MFDTVHQRGVKFSAACYHNRGSPSLRLRLGLKTLSIQIEVLPNDVLLGWPPSRVHASCAIGTHVLPRTGAARVLARRDEASCSWVNTRRKLCGLARQPKAAQPEKEKKQCRFQMSVIASDLLIRPPLVIWFQFSYTNSLRFTWMTAITRSDDGPNPERATNCYLRLTLTVRASTSTTWTSLILETFPLRFGDWVLGPGSITVLTIWHDFSFR